MYSPRQNDIPRELTKGESSLIIDAVGHERKEMEKLLKKKKELILREEEEEVQHPRAEFSALDRLDQRSGYQLDFPDSERVPRFANKDWEEPGTLEEHKKVTLAWVVGCILFASMLGVIVVTWQCWRRKKEDQPSPCEFMRGFVTVLRKKKKKTSTSAEKEVREAQDPIELEPLK